MFLYQPLDKYIEVIKYIAVYSSNKTVDVKVKYTEINNLTM